MQDIVKNIIKCIFFDDKYNVMEEEIKDIYNTMYVDEIEYTIQDIEEIDEEYFTEILNDIVDLWDVGVIQLVNSHLQRITIKLHNKGKRNYISVHSNINNFKNVIPLECFWWVDIFTKLYKNDFVIVNC